MPLLCFAIAASALWAACAPSLRASENLLAEFPIEFCEECPRPMFVPVTVAGRECRFQIDTGTSTTTLSRRLRSLLGPLRGSKLVWTAFGSARQDIYRAPRCCIGGQRLPWLETVHCADVSAGGAQLDGILGVDALSRFVLQFDFDQRVIRFLRIVPSEAGEKLQFIVPNSVPGIVGTIGHRERFFKLDTGFPGHLTLMKSDFDAFVERGELLEANVRELNGAGERFRSRVGALKVPFTLASHSHPSLVVSEIPDVDAPGTIIGLGYLARFLVTIDFPNSAIYLKPGKSYKAIMPLTSLFGVCLGRDRKNDVIILSIAEDSRAAKWGTVGNVVETINGSPAKAMSDAEIVQRLTDDSQERLVNFRRPSDGWKSWMKLPAMPARAPTSTIREPSNASDTKKGHSG